MSTWCQSVAPCCIDVYMVLICGIMLCQCLHGAKVLHHVHGAKVLHRVHGARVLHHVVSMSNGAKV